MTANIDVTPGTGKTVATDEVGGFQVQQVKVVYGASTVGVRASVGAGAVDTGTPRTTLASDDPAVAGIGATNSSAAANPSATSGLNGVIKGMWTGLVAGIGAIGDTAWSGTGNGSAIAILKAIATQTLSTAAQAIFPLPATPVSGLTSSMSGTTSTAVTGIGAASGKNNYITSISITNTDADTDSNVELQDGSGGTTFYVLPGPRGGAVILFPTPLKQPTANTALYCKNSTTGATTIVSVTGFQA